MENYLEILPEIKPNLSHQFWKLGTQQIHLWSLYLDPPERILTTLISLLSEQEKIKAERYKFKQHQSRYQAVHGMLRIILGRYLNLDHQQIDFTESDRGKPSLAAHCNSLNLQFNLSHSENMAIVGISRDRRIGVDVEKLRSQEDALSLAQRFFCHPEYTLLEQARPEERDKLFFQLWTAKEAYLKATGAGISGGLDQVEITLNPLQFISLPEKKENPKQWHLQSFSLAPQGNVNYWAAIAIEGDVKNIQVKHLSYF